MHLNSNEVLEIYHRNTDSSKYDHRHSTFIHFVSKCSSNEVSITPSGHILLCS